MKLMIACGGTGGHIYPALAVAPHFKDVFFVGGDRLEKELVPREGYRFFSIAASPRNPWLIIKGIIQSLVVILREKPTVVLGTGGYVCFPAVFAAWLLRTPVFLQEQNLLPGKVNRFLAKFARKIFISFPGSAQYFPNHKVVYTGNPVRQNILKMAGLAGNPTKVLVFGGSLAARTINLATKALCLKPEWLGRIVLLDGTNYCHDMAKLYAEAALVVCRAGATTLAELAVLGKPAILIPYPYAAQNHQELNARVFEQSGAAKLILDKELSAESLENSIAELLDNPDLLDKMAQQMLELGRPQAAKLVSEQLSLL